MSNSNTSQRRLFKDLKKMQSEELPGRWQYRRRTSELISFFLGINATPVDDDMRVWNALIDGPADTCYEDGLFTLRMEFAGRRDFSQYQIVCFAIRHLSIDATKC